VNEPLYKLRGVRKVYGVRQVLDIEHLDLYSGEVFALVGPSGAGKSTLLRLLNFLEVPFSGSITFLGSEWRPGTEIPLELRRRVTTVFQRPMLLDRSVWENVAYGLRLRGMRDGKSEIEAALEEVGLSGISRQRAVSLSGGEAQRVALARALVLKPTVLLMDEPTANLDPYNVRLIEEISRRLNQEKGVSLVLVTHNVFQARRLAHRTALMLEGRLVEAAETEKFFEAPDDPRTSAFVRGEMVY
jgi:tungstate transport system ATP-binding protein